jgi:hypothetical protein
MSDQKKQDFSASSVEKEDEREETYIDFSDPKAVKEALAKAFKEYAWPTCAGLVPTNKSWRRKGNKLVPPKTRASDKAGSKFKIERLEKILGLLGMGMYFEHACDVASVSSRQVAEWIKRGEKEGKGPYWVFARAVGAMAASVEARCTSVVHKFIHARREFPTKDAADTALRFLAVRFPKRWRTGMDVTSDGKPLQAGGERTLQSVTVKFVDAATATQDPQPKQEARDFSPEEPIGKTIFDA